MPLLEAAAHVLLGRRAFQWPQLLRCSCAPARPSWCGRGYESVEVRVHSYTLGGVEGSRTPQHLFDAAVAYLRGRRVASRGCNIKTFSVPFVPLNRTEGRSSSALSGCSICARFYATVLSIQPARCEAASVHQCAQGSEAPSPSLSWSIALQSRIETLGRAAALHCIPQVIHSVPRAVAPAL